MLVRILKFLTLPLLACSMLSGQIRCELGSKNQVLILGVNNQNAVDVSNLSKQGGRLYFHIDRRSSNRFTVFFWRFGGTLTDIDNTSLIVGDSLAFDFVDIPGYGVYPETQIGVSFYGREKEVKGCRVFTLDGIRGLPRFSTPITLQPLQPIPAGSGSK
jgi:hypothetical protein